MAALIVAVIVAYAIKKAAEDTRAHFGHSRTAHRSGKAARSRPRRAASAVQHDAGYWAHQVLNGFPQARHGFARGWHTGRQAQAQGYEARQAARADHLETRASLIPQIRDHLRRQREAAERIREERETGEGSREGTPAPPLMAPPPAAHRDPHPVRLPDPGPDGLPQFRGGAGSEQDPGGEGDGRPTRRVDGKPETPADTRFFDLRESGYTGPVDQDGNAVAAPWPPFAASPARGIRGGQRERGTPGDGQQQGEGGEGNGERSTSPGAETAPPNSPDTEGSNAMAAAQGEVTYDGTMAHMQAAANAEEASFTERQAAAATANQIAEEMQALRVDAGTLSDMADYVEAQQEALKAQQRVAEAAQTVQATLARGHQGLNEAHQDAPVTAADREFYAG